MDSIDNLERAKCLHQEGGLEQAILIYKSLVKKDKSLLEAWHLLAMAYTQSEQYNKALLALNKVIALAPGEVGFLNSRANVFIRLDNTLDAIESLNCAIRIDPGYAIAYNTLGRCYYLQNNLSLAWQNYNKAIELDDCFVEAHYNLALLYLKQDKLKDAISELKVVIQLQPSFYRAHGQLGEAQLNVGDFNSSIVSFLQRLELQPHHANTYYSLGVAYFKEAQFSESCLAFEQALSLDCQESDLCHLLGNAYVELGDPAKALNYYMKQLEVSPLVECYYNIGVILMHQDRNKDALTYLMLAKDLDSNYLPTYINLGSIYLKLNQLDNATDCYKQAISLDPANEELQHILAAISQNNLPDKAPASYIENLFNQYAIYYDKHLTDVLDFKVPEYLYSAVDTVLLERESYPDNWFIVDVGCGTGLVAPLFKPLSHRLVGIDLSEKMIEVAKTKDLYDELVVMAAEDIADCYSGVDLIIASDVLSYIGDLVPIFKVFASVIVSNGLLAFSVESTSSADYILQTTIRYAHNKSYIESSLEGAGMRMLSCSRHVIRTQQKQAVYGYVVVAELLV